MFSSKETISLPEGMPRFEIWRHFNTLKALGACAENFQ